MSELKWRLENGTYNALAVRHAAGEFRGPMARYADTADIIQVLKANPEACAEVLDALGEAQHTALDDAAEEIAQLCGCSTYDYPAQLVRWVRDLKARAEQAERERDEARAEVSEWHALSEAVGFAHEPDTGPVVVDAAAREAFAEWTVRARRAESDAFELTVERDTLKAKLAAAEREKLRWSGIADHAEKMLELAWLELGPDDNHETVSGAIRDLRSRLTACEKVVESARQWAEQDSLYHRHSGSGRKADVLDALRALDAAQAKDSGGSGAALGASSQCDGTERAAREKAESRASAAEAKLAALSALIHTESGLDDHRYTPEQMVKEMAARWQGASDDCEAAERVVEATVRWRKARAACLGIRDAADALASATWVWEAHKTSAGSGAATPEGGHAAPTSGPMPPPEPAGTTQAAQRFLDEWNRLSAVRRATMRETFPALHAAFVAAFPPHTAQPFGHISKADECQIDSDSPVGVAATDLAAVTRLAKDSEWQGSGGSKHRCSVCGCYWRLNDPTDTQPDGSWSIWDGRQKPGQCCDNVRMGEQIKPGLPLTRAMLRLADELRRKP